MHCNIEPSKLQFLKDHQARIALPFYRGDKWVEYIGINEEGPQRFRMQAREFDNQFKFEGASSLRKACLSLLRACRRAYQPGDGVVSIILEVYTMAEADGKLLSEMSLDELTARYNELSTAIGGTTVKSFKSKKEALERIQKVSGDASAPTPEQRENKKASAAAAEKRLAPLKDKADKQANNPQGKEAEMATKDKKTTTKKGAAKKAAPAKKSAAKAAPAKKGAPKKAAGAERTPRGQGIGAFAEELILKGKPTEDILDAIKKKFPHATTGASSIAWYRNKLRGEGKL